MVGSFAAGNGGQAFGRDSEGLDHADGGQCCLAQGHQAVGGKAQDDKAHAGGIVFSKINPLNLRTKNPKPKTLNPVGVRKVQQEAEGKPGLGIQFAGEAARRARQVQGQERSAGKSSGDRAAGSQDCQLQVAGCGEGERQAEEALE